MNDIVIKVKRVCKQFAEGIYAAWDLSFELPKGTLLALLGPSGCGKTTALRLIAGLETPDAGEIWLNGQCVAGPTCWVPPEARRIGMVFQDYALFPHLTIGQNVAFPLNKWKPADRERRVAELLALVGMAGYAERYPHQLSGGQQQRAALARALAANPAVVLLDEPFSNLDAALRKTMREEVRSILRAANATAIFVTHDQEEALSIADQVAVMDRGAIQQIGTPQHVYFRPATRAIASFVGEANFLPGIARGQVVECALGTLLLAAPLQGEVAVMIRPEALRLKPEADGPACVESITFYGHDQTAQVRLNGSVMLQVRMTPRPDILPNTRARVSVQGPVVAYPVGHD
ncbi:MAG: ABC transporter ATP-binding protein [Anaerolineae bacterium]|nr:ABC transporter ATP-binding protein [Anaerolineae bacterium]